MLQATAYARAISSQFNETVDPELFDGEQLRGIAQPRAKTCGIVAWPCQICDVGPREGSRVLLYASELGGPRGKPLQDEKRVPRVLNTTKKLTNIQLVTKGAYGVNWVAYSKLNSSGPRNLIEHGWQTLVI